MIRDLVQIVAHPFVLGVCCLALGIVAIVQRDQINDLIAQDRCFDPIEADLDIETARSLQRIEASQRERATGDWQAATAAVVATDDELDDYERAITRRENAVAICRRG